MNIHDLNMHLGTPPTVLVVDDDPDIRQVLRLGFESASYRILEAESSGQLFHILKSDSCDLITLDLRLGNTDGLLLARQVRSTLNLPIIMITGRDEPLDRLTGLEHGADDYITKPFLIKEVLIRAARVLERYASERQRINLAVTHRFQIGHFVLDTKTMELRDLSGTLVELTETERRLLETLALNPSRVISRDDLWKSVRGRDWSPLDRTLDSHIARLRRKIESTNDEEPRLIKSVRGVGYVLTASGRIS